MSFYLCHTIVIGAEWHALSALPLPQGDESGLWDLSHDGGQVLFAVAKLGWRKGLGVSAITASKHRLALGEKEVQVSWEELCVRHGQRYILQTTSEHSVGNKVWFPITLKQVLPTASLLLFVQNFTWIYGINWLSNAPNFYTSLHTLYLEM